MASVVGYVPGVFDMFHIGHLNIRRNARLGCDVLIAGVVSDEQSTSTKLKAPIVPLLERPEIVSAVRLVDETSWKTLPRSWKCRSAYSSTG